MSTSVVVGVDSGGTKTAAVVQGPGGTHRVVGPGAQALRDGIEGAADTVAQVVRRALEGQDAPLGALALGIAGAGRADTRAALADALHVRFGGMPIRVYHDAEVAYHGAWGDESGALLLVGTGSLVLARDHDGQFHRAGGWGAALGDDGSGTALGRAAIRALLATLDGGPPSAFPDLAAERLGLDSSESVLRAVHMDRQPLASFASLALAAAQAGDWTAESILRAQVNALAKQVGWLATRTDGRVRQRLRYLGGLSNEAVYVAALADALGRYLPGWSVEACPTEPAHGALALAKKLLAS